MKILTLHQCPECKGKGVLFNKPVTEADKIKPE
jgi:hypothetical protein